MERVRIWTDGCCLNNPGGPGAWAIVVEHSGHVLHEASGGVTETTNNRMEMAAVIEALNYSARCLGQTQVEIVSDSKYVVDGTNSWMHSWARRDWKRKVKGKVPVKNVVHWQTIHRLFTATARVKVTWIKGHAGHKFNELADLLAADTAREQRDLRERPRGRPSTTPQNAESPPAPAAGTA